MLEGPDSSVVVSCQLRAYAEERRSAGAADGDLFGETLRIMLVVNEGYRGLGLGVEFVSRLEAWGRSRGATEARWPVTAAEVETFARKCGYCLQGLLYVKSLQTAGPVVGRQPPLWEAGGVYIESEELSWLEVSPFVSGPESSAAAGAGPREPMVYRMVIAETLEHRAGSVRGVVVCDMLLVCDLMVSYSDQGRGLGTELLLRLEAWGRELGATEAWQHPALEALGGFAVKRGYRRDGPVFAKSLETAPEAVRNTRKDKNVVFRRRNLLCFRSS